MNLQQQLTKKVNDVWDKWGKCKIVWPGNEKNIYQGFQVMVDTKDITKGNDDWVKKKFI